MVFDLSAQTKGNSEKQNAKSRVGLDGRNRLLDSTEAKGRKCHPQSDYSAAFQKKNKMKMTNNSILNVLTMKPDWQSQESSRKGHIYRKQKATVAFPGLGGPYETESQNEADPAQ